MLRLLSVAAATALLTTTLVPAHAADASGDAAYKVVKTISLGAPDRWDYLTFDAPSHRVYVSHGDQVTVIDGRSGQLVGSITGMTGGTHGIAIAHVAGVGYTDDGRAGEAVAFDLKTLKPVKRLKAEEDADGIVMDPASGNVFVMDGDSGKVTVINPGPNEVVATIDAGGGVEFGASDANGKFFVNGADKNEIVRIDTATNRVDAHWPMAGCTSPHGLAIDRTHHRLFSTCANKVMVVMDSNDGHIVTTLPVGQFSDAAVFDPVHSLAFSSNIDGTITVVQEKSADEFVELPAIKTSFGARTMAEDPQTGRIYVVTANYTENPNSDNPRRRFTIQAGSAKLLFIDPAQ